MMYIEPENMLCVVVECMQLYVFENLIHLERSFMPEAASMPSAGDFRGLVVGL